MKGDFVKDHALKFSGVDEKQTSHKYDMKRLVDDIIYSLNMGFVTVKRGQSTNSVARSRFLSRISFTLKGVADDLSAIFDYFNGQLSEDSRYLLQYDSQYFEKRYDAFKRAIIGDISVRFLALFERVGAIENVPNGKSQGPHSKAKLDIEALIYSEENSDLCHFLSGFVKRNYSKINDAPFCFYQSALRAEIALLVEQFQFLEKNLKDENGHLLADSFIKKTLQEGNKFSVILKDKQMVYEQAYHRIMRYPARAALEQFYAIYLSLDMNAALLDPAMKQLKLLSKDGGSLEDIISKAQYDVLSNIQKALQDGGGVVKVNMLQGDGRNHLLHVLLPKLFIEKQAFEETYDLDDLIKQEKDESNFVHFLTKKADVDQIKLQKSLKGEVLVIDESLEVGNIDDLQQQGAVLVILEKNSQYELASRDDYHAVDFDLFADGRDAIFRPKRKVNVKSLNEIDMFLAYYQGGEDNLFDVIKNLLPSPDSFQKMAYILPDFLIDEKSSDASNLRPLFAKSQANIVALPHVNQDGSKGAKVAYGANGEFQKIIYSDGALGMKQIIKNVNRILKKQDITNPKVICFYDATNATDRNYDVLDQEVDARYVHFTDIVCLAREYNPVSWEMLMNLFGFDDALREVEQKIIFCEIAQEGEDVNYVHEFAGENKELVIKRIDENSY